MALTPAEIESLVSRILIAVTGSLTTVVILCILCWPSAKWCVSCCSKRRRRQRWNSSGIGLKRRRKSMYQMITSAESDSESESMSLRGGSTSSPSAAQAELSTAQQAASFAASQKRLQIVTLVLLLLNMASETALYAALPELPTYLAETKSEELSQMIDGSNEQTLNQADFFVQFWLVLWLPKNASLILTILFFSAIITWFARTYYFTRQQTVLLRIYSREGLSGAERVEDGTKYHPKGSFTYHLYMLLWKYLSVGWMLVNSAFALALLLGSFLMREMLYYSELARLLFVGIALFSSTTATVLCATIFLYLVLHHTKETEFAHDTLYIVRRFRRSWIPLGSLVIVYMLVFSLWLARVPLLSCIRFRFPFQPAVVPPQHCTSFSNVQWFHLSMDKDNYLTSETLIWFILFKVIPFATLAVLFRPVEREKLKSVLHLRKIVSYEPTSTWEVQRDPVASATAATEEQSSILTARSRAASSSSSTVATKKSSKKKRTGRKKEQQGQTAASEASLLISDPVSIPLAQGQDDTPGDSEASSSISSVGLGSFSLKDSIIREMGVDTR